MERLEGTESLEETREGPDGTEKELTERRGTRWNGEGPDGAEDLIEWRGTRWNGGTQDETEGDQMERRDSKERRDLKELIGTRTNGERLEGTERNRLERRGTRWNG